MPKKWQNIDIEDIKKHVSKGLLIDTNILIVFLTGLYKSSDLERITKKPKNESVYFPEDFEIIKSFIKYFNFKKIVVTPQILTEVSNLTFKDYPEGKDQDYVKEAISFAKRAYETHFHKDYLANQYHLEHVGFSDSSIIETAKKEQCVVLTGDFNCTELLTKEGCCVCNFNHLRTTFL